MENGIRRLKNAVPLLLEWYGVSRRDLPWRGTHDPYRVWLSEIMLQQTRVEAVKEYYLRFLARFPDASALAAADEEEVLKAWEGLGYYSRARNLHRAAKIIAEEGFPRTEEGVRALPGVGDYTAGAVCSIAFGLPCPAVDGNVLRVLSRLLADGRCVDEPSVRADLARMLRAVYPKEAGDFCQALMELGAVVCIPNGEPCCSVCPWRELCAAHLAGEEEHYPVRREKRARRVERLGVYVLHHEGKYALRKRADKGLLAGMWEFPNAPAESDPPRGRIADKRTARHVFTHVEWEMTGYLIEAEERSPAYVWATAEEIRERYALPSAFKGFLDWLR